MLVCWGRYFTQNIFFLLLGFWFLFCFPSEGLRQMCSEAKKFLSWSVNDFKLFWSSLSQLQNTYLAEHISLVASKTSRRKLWNLLNPFATNVSLASTYQRFPFVFWEHNSGTLVENWLIKMFNFYYKKGFVISLIQRYLKLQKTLKIPEIRIFLIK